MSKFYGRMIKTMEGSSMPIKPEREAFSELSDEEFSALISEYNLAMNEWRDAQKGKVDGHTENSDKGPGVSNWIDPDSVSGPGVK